MRVRQAAGGGRVVEVEPDRLVGWVQRFAHRHGPAVELRWATDGVTALAADGSSAEIAAPFPPMTPSPAEPLEALIDHIDALGPIGMVLVRERAFSVGICRDGRVQASSTDTRYVQSRTAAGGWSQQRYARRRGNQRRDSFRAAADAAARVVAAEAGRLRGLVVGGDATAIRSVLDDPRLAALADLPRRTFTDIAEPRRAVLDVLARRCRTVQITVHDGDQPDT